MTALLWLFAGALLVAAELVSGEFVLVMLGAAALGTAGASALGVGFGWDVAVFAALAALLIFTVRPPLKRRLLARTDPEPMGVQALVGKSAQVESTVDSQGGQVRIEGQIWSARSFDETQVLEVGRTVRVMEISGATAVVWDQP